MINLDKLIESKSTASLAKIWCHLNRREWPSCLGAKPQCKTVPSKVMRMIKDRIGIKECLRAWNCEMDHPPYMRISNRKFEWKWSRWIGYEEEKASLALG